MNEEFAKPVHPEVQCTIWVKDKNDRFTGIISNDGGFNEAGMMLINHWNSSEKAHDLMQLGALRCLGKSIQTSEKLPRIEKGPMFKDYGEGMALTVSKAYTNGAYCYVYDEGCNEWKIGINCKISLKKILQK